MAVPSTDRMMRALRLWRPSLPASPGLALVQRDFIRSLRRVRPFVFLLVLMVVQLWVVYTQLPPSQGILMNSGIAAHEIFMFFVMIMLAAGALLLPGAAATSVVLEREQETYDLVRLTMMRRITFIIAKAANACGYFFVFVLASIPVVASVFFLTGLDMKQVFFSFAVLLAASVSTTMIGVYASCRSRHSMRALLAAYLLTAVFMGGHVLLAMLGAGMLFGQGMIAAGIEQPWEFLIKSYEAWAPAATPPYTIVEFDRGGYGYDLLGRALAYHGMLALVFLMLAWRALHEEQRGKKEFAVDRFLSRLHKPAFRPIADWVNPIAIKERRWSMGLHRRGMWALVVFAYAFFFLVAGLATSRNVFGLLWFVLTFGMLCLLVPVLLVTTLTREKDMLNLDMLRMTVLTPRQIVLGKLWPGGSYLLLMLPGLLLAATTFEDPWTGADTWGVIGGVTTGTACLFFYSGMCAWIAARCARTATAITAAYAAGFATGIGWPLLMMSVFADGKPDDFFVGIICMTAPFFGWVITMSEHDYYVPWLLGIAGFFAMGVVFFRMAFNRYLSDGDNRLSLNGRRHENGAENTRV